MDIKSKRANELLLQHVVQEAPAHVVGLMGIHVMDVLTAQLSSKDFTELLADAEEYANNIMKMSSGAENEPAQPGEPQK